MRIIAKHVKGYILALGNTFRVKSIQFIITASFALITILAMLFIGAIIYDKFNQTTEKNVGTNASQIIEQVSLNLDNYNQSINGLVNSLTNTIERRPNLPDLMLNDQMNTLLGVRDDLTAIGIFLNTGELIMGNPFSRLKPNANVPQQEWFKTAMANPYDIFISSPHVDNIFELKQSWVISASKNVSFNYNGMRRSGVLLLNINFNTIDQLCRKVRLGSRGYIYIIDSAGNIIYHPQQQLVYLGLKEENYGEALNHDYGSFNQDFQGEKRLLTVKNVGYTDWKVLGVAYMDELVATQKDVVKFSGWILFFAVIFVISVFIFISAKITRPIKLLDSSMKLVEEGRFDINVDVKGDQEVVHLSKTFNLMVARIRQLMDQIIVEQEAKRKSELNALQAQINPHFLYNTLDSIVWMAENEKSQDVITMVTSLARLFRISISRGKNIITVGEEIEHARNYLVIQKIRYKNKFNYEIEVQQEALQFKTLKLILQPIIENAIYHGIEYMVDEGNIKISVKVMDNKLLYEVRDNGLGMKKEILDKILSYESKNIGGSGVGVKNVHERIQLCFGKEYGLEIESEIEEGTTVKLWLPLIKDESLVV